MIPNKKNADWGKQDVCCDQIEHAEDKIIELCNSLEKDGASSLEIASALLFSIHYMITKQEHDTAEKHYRRLFQQYRDQIRSFPEFY